MKIITCLKEVPSRDTRYEVNAETTWIKEADLTMEASESDEYALEEALKLQERHGGEVAILSVGPERAEKSIRKGLAMGANRGILVKDNEGRIQSPMVTAAVLAEALKREEFDLILTGVQSDDLGSGQTGVMLAEFLGLPYATIVMEIEADPDAKTIRALREMESGWFERVELPLPAVLTIQAGISPIRYASLKGIMQARKKELRRVEFPDLGLDLESIPSLDILKVYFPVSEKKAEILQGDTADVVATLVEKLKKEAHVL